ncbi:MAG: PIG-L family deacetylase [Rubricoccaceae bacterium]|nr:PIG-L family deacetylase [Rubricoccaceae bacterium]
MSRSILYVFPHPDDESFGPGPAIARQVREGHAVHLLTLTRGGATKQRHRLGLSVDEMGAVRAREMQCVEGTYGLASFTLRNYPDRGLAALDPRVLEREVAARVRAVRPDVLVTYAVEGVSGHPDHLVAHAVVKRVFCALREEGRLHRLALFTVVEREGDPDADRPVALCRTPPGEIDARVTFNDADRATAEAALACYESYRAVIEAHDPLAEVAGGVPFVLFDEVHQALLDSLTADLPPVSARP